MKLGQLSLSLNVKDIKASKEFYEKLGFTMFAGNIDERYLIMKNEDSLIGLFQGMFENNIITFNPGWDSSGKELTSFDDVRKIEDELFENQVIDQKQIEKNTKGPASLMITDPDGNVILIDQHV